MGLGGNYLGSFAMQEGFESWGSLKVNEVARRVKDMFTT